MEQSSLFLLVSLLECRGVQLPSEYVKCVLTLGEQYKVSKATRNKAGRCFFNQQFIFPFKPNSELKVVIMQDSGGETLELHPRDYAIDVVFSDSPKVNIPVADWFELATVGEITGASHPEDQAVQCGQLHMAMVVFNTSFLKSVITQVGAQASSAKSSAGATHFPSSSTTGGEAKNSTVHPPPPPPQQQHWRRDGEGARGNAPGMLLRAWEILAKRQANQEKQAGAERKLRAALDRARDYNDGTIDATQSKKLE